MKKGQLTIQEIDKCLDDLDINPILKSQVRQVRWLYHNSNKCNMVYDEKLVRAIVQRLQDRIKQLESIIYMMKKKQALEPKNKYCWGCGEPLTRKHKLWCKNKI